MLNFFVAYHKYFTAAGLVGLAIYQATQSEFSQAGTSVLSALAALGLSFAPAPAPAAAKS